MAPPSSNTIGSAWRSFWHSITTSDRHASHDAPYRTGQHVPLSSGRHDPLTSVSANADESRTNLATALDQEDSNSSNTYFTQAGGSSTPGTPYTPGMRSTMQRRESADATDKSAGAEVQMQTFSDGLPPPPPVRHSWKRIDRWTEDNYEELSDNISEGCTQNDINELEHELDCTLPQEVRESLQVHDGQERGGRPTGIMFGSMLLDCEEIVEEWKNWRRVSEEYLNATTQQTQQVSLKAFGGSGESSSSNPPQAQNEQTKSNWREELLARQDSQPSNACQKAYSHPAWIPLVRDWGGNCIAVDLAPGSAGKWGQVILMGRDYDCKYVISRSWAAFLAVFADDLTSRKAWIEEETGALKLREFKGQNIDPSYFDILRWRTDQKYGRKPPRKRSIPNGDLRVNPNVPTVASRGSPYASPAGGDADRGRSPQRFPGKGISTQSPRTTISSPLARVAEETPSAIPTHVNSPSRKASIAESEALIGTESPRMSVADDSKIRDFAVNGSPTKRTSVADKENQRMSNGLSGLSLKNVDVGSDAEAGEDMKTVAI